VSVLLSFLLILRKPRTAISKTAHSVSGIASHMPAIPNATRFVRPVLCPADDKARRASDTQQQTDALLKDYPVAASDVSIKL
jgi:hypothetical protein